jgi:predicted RNA-binding Zn ribbon-like protein
VVQPETAPTGRLVIRVEGLPPAKQISPLLAPSHPHRSRVIALLEATREALSVDFAPFPGAVALSLTLFTPDALPPGDPTNFLGGVADVLQRKADVFALDALSDVMVYENDAQLRRIEFQQVPDDRTHYELRIHQLDLGPIRVPHVPSPPSPRNPLPVVSADQKVLARANDLALRFVNVMTDRARSAALPNYESLLEWMYAPQDLSSSASLAALKDLARAAPLDGRRCFDQAKALAAALRSLFLSLDTQVEIPELSRLAATCALLRRVQADVDGGLTVVSAPTATSLESQLCPVLDSVLELMSPAVRPRIRVCRDSACGLLFLDRTKNANRAWCSMNTCGSRAKVRTWRLRHAKLEEGAVTYVVT